MRAGRPSVASRLVQEETCVRLTLVLRTGTMPVEGTVVSEGRPPLPFTGWLPLLSILEAASQGCLEPTPGASEENEA